MVTSESDAAMGQTFWYTVRAVDTSACSPQNYSGHSAASYGVPRDRVGPEKPTGSLINCFCIPKIERTNSGISTSRPPYGLEDRDPGFVVRVNRLDEERSTIVKKIKSFDLEYGEYDFEEQTGNPCHDYRYQGVEPHGDVVVLLADREGQHPRACPPR